MAIELISKIKQKNNGNFKLVDACDVEYENPSMDSISENHIDNVADALDAMYSIINTAPSLSYVEDEGFREGERKYWEIGEQMRLVFSFSSSASGKCNVTILRNGFTFKTISMNKGRVVIDLGVATDQNNYIYTVSAVDSLGRDADKELTFNHIVGGVEISSTFENIIESTIFTANSATNIDIPISISYAEDNKPRFISYSIINKNTGDVVIDEEYDCGNSNWSSTLNLNDIIFSNTGVYTITFQGKVIIDGNSIYSNILKYDFAVIESNTIAVTVVNSKLENITTSDNASITFRTVTNVGALMQANSMAVRCNLYYINEDGSESLTKQIYISNISFGDVKTWNIGRLSVDGNYRYELVGEPIGGASDSINLDKASGTFSVAYSEVIGDNYVTSNLIAYFDANDMDNNNANCDIWKSKNSGLNNYYYIKLHGLNYSRNGWLLDENDGSKMLKFSGDSYGELRYVDINGEDTEFSPISLMNSAATGNALEVVFRTRCIGQMDACVLSCRDENIDNYGGYSIYFDKAKISSNEQSTTTPINESNTEFTHITFVIDKNIRDFNNGINNTNIENLNTVATMNMYVNGIRTKVIPINDNEQFANTSSFPAIQLYLNAYYDTILKKVTGFGSCEIKSLRIYNSALTAEQVLGNYINSKYDLNERQALVNKNDAVKADIPIVHFVRNKTIKDNTSVYSKYSKDVPFSILNSITTKSAKDPSIPTSKNSWVNCTMWYTYLDKLSNEWVTVKYDDVDVYLQGTSTLQFPIKNYKIKVFNSSVVNGVPTRGKKLKFIPPNKVGEDGWLVPDNTYTFKCDFMEESHKNNTPTAIMYEKILDKVVEYNNGEFSPCKRPEYEDAYTDVEVVGENGEKEIVTKRKYRDAINGFPILVYYNENDTIDSVTNVPMDYNEISTVEEGYYSNTGDVMVGTMMFNIDKAGAAIGFEPESHEPINVTNPVTGEPVKYTDGTDVVLDTIPCVSLEGSSNAAIPVAASFYTMEEANEYTYKADYLEPKYTILRDGAFIDADVTYEEFYDEVQSGLHNGVYSYEEYCELPDTGIFKDIYEYISATFDIRYSWTDELLEKDKELSEKDYNECTYGHIINAINWLNESYNDRDKFRDEFEQYFDFSYCATYYLQMITLIQVDNAGKNAMFDKWFGHGVMDCGGIKARPYDMDTQMCLNNSGEDAINVSAEVNIALSPTGITGTYANQCNVSNKDTDKNHKRYSDYNTPNSKFWNAFGTYFKDELNKTYGELRKTYYNTDWICDNVNAVTSDIIGESFYNKDAGAKYMSQTYYEVNDNGTTSIHSEMLPKLNGNRDSRYRQVIDQRIIFMDTWFNYSSGDSLNTSINLRSDANTAGYSSVQVGISVYSPCYVRIDIGTGNDAIIVAYIDTDSRYQYNGETYEGVLFTLPIMANNKDITIHAAGNIKSINHMENLVITNFNLSNAKKITSLSIPSSTALKTLVTGSNTYLRTFNVSSSKTLEGNINLSNCENLQSVDISGTKLSSISLPEGGNVKQFIAKNCGLTSVLFKDLQFLETINIEGCNNIVSYELNGCPLINEVNTSGYINLNKIILSKCDGLTSLNLSNTNIAEMSITNCDNLNDINLSNCSGLVMNNLNLSTVYGLITLNITSAQPSAGIILYLPKYKVEYASLSPDQIQECIDNGENVYWEELINLYAASSNLKNIAYGIETNLESGICDFIRLTKLQNLTIKNSLMIKEIINLNYTGNMNGLFENVAFCEKISGNLKSTGTAANTIFNNCLNLKDFSQLTFDFSSVTSAYSGMRRCISADFNMAKKLLDSMPNVTNLSMFLAMDTTKTDSQAVFQIGSNLFEKTTKVTDLGYFFLSNNIKSLPSGLLEPVKNSLDNLTAFCYGCRLLKTVPNNLFKNCSKVKKYSGMFHSCTSLVNFLNSGNYYDIFPSNSPATETYIMFYNCNKLVASIPTDSENGLKKMFDNLPNLTNAEAMFYNTNFITGIPLGVFENNTKLVDISAMFALNNQLTSFPAMLFNTSVKTSTTHKSLVNARGLFSSCTNLEGIISSNFFTGAFNLKDIGNINNLQLNVGPTIVYTGGMFANTNIMGYEYNFLYKLTELTSASMLFYKGSCSSASMTPTVEGNNNESLIYVYIGNDAYPNRIFNGLFSKQTKLKDVKYCFAGNINFTTFCDEDGNDVNDPTLFNNCKSTLNNAEGLFANCTGLSVDVPRVLFNDCTALSTLRSCYAGCSNLSGSLPEDLLKGCRNLVYTNYMFFGCNQVGVNDLPTDISVPAGIFDSCRNTLVNTSYMFDSCGFNGMIGTGEVEIAEDDETGLTTYTIIKHGLLSECLKLNSVAHMFRGCKDLKGAIPEDMFFTPDATKLYVNLTDLSYLFDNCDYLAMNSTEYGIDSRNKQLIYGNDLLPTESGYLIPMNWLNKCPNIKNIQHIFNHVSNPLQVDAQFNCIELLLADMTFSQQTKIQLANNAFFCVKSLAASLTSVFMQNSLNTLVDASRIFAYSNLKQAGAVEFYAVFEKNTSLTAKNNVLNNLECAFYHTNNDNMTGYGPSPSKFTALNSSSAMVYNQTKLNNYKSYSIQQQQSYDIYNTSYRYSGQSYNVNAIL